MNKFAIFFLFATVSLATLFTACEDEDPTIIDSSLPQGSLTVSKTGNFVAENGTGSMGVVNLGTDRDGTQFLQFGSNFTTNFATGTVTVYLSTSAVFTPDPANGNPNLRLVGPVNKAGENFFKLDPAADNKFTHVILWCASANVPFGNAAIN